LSKNHFFIDKQGRRVLEDREYDSRHRSSYNLFSVRRNGKWGYVNDETWEEVFPCAYQMASPFSSNRALVKIYDKCYFLDKNSKLLTDSNFNYTYCTSSFEANRLLVGRQIDNKTRYGFVDENWQEVILCQYDDAYSFDTNQQAQVKLNGKTFYINTKGVCVKDCP
jgi:hypothetical protein